jgi:hypothetical protein
MGFKKREIKLIKMCCGAGVYITPLYLSHRNFGIKMFPTFKTAMELFLCLKKVLSHTMNRRKYLHSFIFSHTVSISWVFSVFSWLFSIN